MKSADDWDEEIADSVDDEIWDAFTFDQQSFMRRVARNEESKGAFKYPVLSNERDYARFLKVVYKLSEDEIQEAIQKVKRRTKLKAFQ